MAVKYLRSAAAGAGTGADWTNAYTTLATALSGMAAGDTLYVADDHAETTAGTMTLTSPGTAGNPCRVICVNTHVSTPPTATATSATVTATASSSLITFGAGYAYVYGIAFSCGQQGQNAISWKNGSAWGWTHESCAFNVTAVSGTIQVGVEGFVAAEYLKWINCTCSFATTGNTLNVTGQFEWQGGSVTAGAATPTTLLTAVGNIPGLVVISGVDLSLFGTGTNLVSGTGGNPVDFYFRNCKLGASVTPVTGAVAGPGGVRVFLENCDSSGTNYRMEHYKYQGSIKQETTKVRTSGATDGTTPISHKFVSLTTGPTLFSPLEGPWVSAWNDTTGASKTATVEFLHDSLTALQTADIYLEVEYLGTSGFPKSIYATNRVTDVFATPANCPAGIGTGSWTTSGLTNPNSQKLQVTFTPQVKGPYRWRVCLVKSNYTVYVDPIASGLVAPSREYLVPGTAYVNETGSAGAAGMLFVPTLDGV